jgi:hypothetical protein
MILSTRILTDEIRDLRAENANLRRVNMELIDKFIFNRQPERIVERAAISKPSAAVPVADGMGDPVSAAERKAWLESKPQDAN